MKITPPRRFTTRQCKTTPTRILCPRFDKRQERALEYPASHRRCHRSAGVGNAEWHGIGGKVGGILKSFIRNDFVSISNLNGFPGKSAEWRRLPILGVFPTRPPHTNQCHFAFKQRSATSSYYCWLLALSSCFVYGG